MRVLLLVSFLLMLSGCASPFAVETRTPGPPGELTLEEKIQLKRQQGRIGGQ